MPLRQDTPLPRLQQKEPSASTQVSLVGIGVFGRSSFLLVRRSIENKESRRLHAAGGEITASSAVAVAETESGKVGGYVENGIYIYKRYSLCQGRALHAARGC